MVAPYGCSRAEQRGCFHTLYVHFNIRKGLLQGVYTGKGHRNGSAGRGAPAPAHLHGQRLRLFGYAAGQQRSMGHRMRIRVQLFKRTRVGLQRGNGSITALRERKKFFYGIASVGAKVKVMFLFAKAQQRG